MIKIAYDPESEMFIFMASPAEDETVMNIDELLEAVSGELALFASCIAGNTKEAYIGLVNALESAGQDKEMQKGLDELIEENKKTIFLNNESLEECMQQIVKKFKDDTDYMIKVLLTDEKDKLIADELKKRLTESFIESMEEMFETSMSDYFNVIKTEEDVNDDYEDDLF